MKKLTAIAIITICLSTAPIFAEYSGGGGIEGNPWQISCPNDLLYLANHTADYGSHFILTADIDLTGYTFTTAVIAQDINNSNSEFDGTEFTGTFDGDGFAIRNLAIDTNGAGNDYLGLFGNTGYGSQIKNVGIENVNINSWDYSRSIGGLMGLNYGTISNCYATGHIVAGVQAFGVGGLVGENFIGKEISNCHAVVIVTGGEYAHYLGGLVGSNYQLSTISNSYATGAVSGGRYSISLGGLVGFNHGSVSNSYATGVMSGGNNSGYIGGLVGYNVLGGTISECFATGAVTGGQYSGRAGGLVGCNYYESDINNCYARGAVTGGWGTYYIGGLVGDNDHSNIGGCYSTGAVSSGLQSGYLAGLVGRNYYGTISNSFWDKITSGRSNASNNVGGTITNVLGKTTVEMKTESTFTGPPSYWDFVGETENGAEDIWHMPYQITGYPMLYWQRDIAGDFIGHYGVSFEDLAFFSQHWLQGGCIMPGYCEGADLDISGTVDFSDFGLLAENWLEGL